MAKSSSQWRYWFKLLQQSPYLNLPETTRRLNTQRWLTSAGWLLAAAAIVTSVSVNDRLVLSSGVGVAALTLIYLLRDRAPKLPSVDLHQTLRGWNQPLILAILGGSVATLTTYMATSIWADSQSHWLAAGAILQGMGTLTVLILLLWQMLSRKKNRQDDDYQLFLADLTHPHSLRRLIAVQQLSSMVLRQHNNQTQRWEIRDCFRLMLKREQEAIVRRAILQGLQEIESERPLQASSQTEFYPFTPGRVKRKVYRRLPVR